MNTYLVFLRFEQMQGHLDSAAYAQELALVRASLTRSEGAHWPEFLAAGVACRVACGL